MRRSEHSDAVGALRRQITRRKFLEVLRGGLGAALVARCAPAPESTPSPTGPPGAPEATATSVPATPTPVPAAEPQVLLYGATQGVATLDPRGIHDVYVDCACRAVYDSLFWQEGWPPRLSPNLCTHYEMSDDVREWIFHLDDRAVFHDGTPVTAEAVEWTLKGVLSFAGPRASSLLPVMNEDSIEVVDNHTLRIVLTTPFADLPWLLGYGGKIFIANPEEVMAHEVDGDQGEAWLLEHAAGSGPFTVKRWEPEAVYEFEAVPDYWRGWPSEGRLAGVVWRVIRDPAERRMAIIGGELDVVDGISADDLDPIDANPGTHTEVHPGFLSAYSKMNNQREPCSDVNFRKFMAYAFDYEGFQTSQGGPELAKLLIGCLPDGVPGHDPNVQPVYGQDLEEARRYLDMTRWADGGLEIEFAYITGLPFTEAMGTFLAEPLARFGITVKLVPYVWPDLVALAAHPETAEYDVFNVFDDFGPIATQWFRVKYYSPFWDNPDGGSWQSASFYKNPDLDDLLERAEVTGDEEERMEMIKDMQRMVMEDVPEIMIYTRSDLLAFSDRVKGYEYTGYLALDFWPLWIEEA